VRIHRIGIRDYKGVDAELPVGSALVLFGPNDGGKTNVLEAIATMLGAQKAVREVVI
jgi:recombinational DNA repair ATPase RecF